MASGATFETSRRAWTAEELLPPEIEWQQKRGKEVVFRADATIAKPEMYEALEKRGEKYAIRIPSIGGRRSSGLKSKQAVKMTQLSCHRFI